MHSKLKELILYVAAQSMNDPTFGSIKMNRILFLIDFTAFGIWGKPVTENVYIHQKSGPVPRDLLTARTELIEDKSAVLQESEFFGHTQRRLIALRRPDLSVFTEAERRLIDNGLDSLKFQDEIAQSQWLRRLIPWLETETGEEIPFFSTFVLEENAVDQDDLAWAKAEIAKLRSEA